MGRFLDPCRRFRRDLCLLAGGALSRAETEAVEKHIATCPDCRAYDAEIKTVTAPIETWRENFASLQPSPAARQLWARAIEAPGRKGAARQLTLVEALHDWWREMIWPWRRIWMGLAAVWVVILAGNISLHSPARALAAKSPPLSREMILSFKDQQKILADLLDPQAPESDPPKRFLPKPRTENVVIIFT